MGLGLQRRPPYEIGIPVVVRPLGKHGEVAVRVGAVIDLGYWIIRAPLGIYQGWLAGTQMTPCG